MRERLLHLIAPLLLCATLACGSFDATPPPNREFVGAWVAKDGSATLAISAEGHVSYAHREGSTSTTIDAPAKAWTDSKFTVGALGISTDFTIEQAPVQIDGVWHMTIDGIEYTRANH